jgi:citrate lyase subunit alpha/citrate CoA-transferase
MPSIEWTTNSLGRSVPSSVDGRRFPAFEGVFAAQGGSEGAGRRLRRQLSRGRPDKLRLSWDDLLDHLELRDGMTVSFHHHLRDGDAIVNETIERLAARGLKGLVIAPTALFPVHDRLVPWIESGVIERVEGSMNGRVGEACSRGAMRGLSVLRSHGGRCRAVETGELHIDLAVIAAPCADPFGDANGLFGKSACGPLGYAEPDSVHADQVVVITDGLVPYPCSPWSILGGNVDQVLAVDSIGDPSRIVSGTTRLTRSPTQNLIAELTARFVEATGVMHEGFSFQAGAGGVSLAAVARIAERMRRSGIKASFAHGGGTGLLVGLLEEGLLGAIVDLQSFDLEAVRSCRENARHLLSTPFASYGPTAAGSSSSLLDLAVLGATEIDLDFNVNVNTHSDGLLLHGIGGHQDAAATSSCCIVTAPSFRKRIPIVRERVTTVSCPGEVIDVLVTERGIAVNPRRGELAELARRAGLPVVEIAQLMEEVHSITGVPDLPVFKDRPVAVVEWRDGSLLDVVRELDQGETSGY